MLILLGSVYIFIIYKHIFWLGDIDKDLFGIFGDFIGGVVGTLFTIATTVLVYQTFRSQKEDVKETKRLTELQMALSIKPDLYFIDSLVHGFSQQGDQGEEYARSFSQKEEFDESSNVYVEMVNIGIGAAKGIEYNWDFDLADAQKYILDNFPENTLIVDPEINSKVLIEIKLNDLKGGAAYGQTGYKLKRKIDILMTGRNRSDSVKIQYPTPYLIYYFLALKLIAQHKMYEKFGTYAIIDNFPKCTLNLAYNDLADVSHKKKFNFHFVSGGVVWSKTSEDNVRLFSFTIQPNEIKPI